MARAVAEAVHAGMAFDEMRTFIEACKQVDEWRSIEGADWDSEIGAVV